MIWACRSKASAAAGLLAWRAVEGFGDAEIAVRMPTTMSNCGSVAEKSAVNVVVSGLRASSHAASSAAGVSFSPSSR